MSEDQITTTSLVVGQFLPPVIDLLNKHVDSSKTRFFISVLVCLLAGVFLNLDKIQFENLGQIFQSFGVIFSSAQVAYKMYYESSTVQAKLRSQY